MTSICCGPDSLFTPCSDPNGFEIIGTDMSLQTVAQLTAAYPPCANIFRFAITRDSGTDRTRLWFSHYNDSGTCVWVQVSDEMHNMERIELPVFESDTDCATGDGKAAVTIPPAYDGYEVNDVFVSGIHTLGVGSTMDIQLRRRREAAEVDVLSTKVTVDPAEYYAADGVIDAANDDLETGDNLYVDVDQVHTTPAKGLTVVIVIRKP